MLPADPAVMAAGRQVVFVESGVADYQVLQRGLAAGTDAVVLDGSGDGLAEMAAFLQGRHGLSAIHILSHGAPGALEAVGPCARVAASVYHEGRGVSWPAKDW